MESRARGLLCLVCLSMFSRFLQTTLRVTLCPFLLNNIPLCGWTAFALSTDQLLHLSSSFTEKSFKLIEKLKE